MPKHQSKIEKLIAELCPEGVEFIDLGDALLPKANIKWQSIGSQTFQYIDLTSVDRVTHKISETQTINAETAPSRAQQIVKTGDVIFGTTRPTLKRFSIIDSIYDGQICSTGFCVLRPDTNNVLTNFIYHLIGSLDFFDYVENTQKGASYPAISDAEVKKFKIPIPPLAIQQEIVKILDTFTTLEAELEVELEARKKQYEWYEDKILFNSSYKYISLNKLCTINQGLQIPISQRKNEPGKNRYFYITVQFLKKNVENFYVENPMPSVTCNEDDVLVTRTGSTGRIVTGIKGCFHNNFFKVNCKENISKRFMYHILKSKRMYNSMLSAASGGTVPDLPHSSFYKLSVPVPPLAEQERIVAILDKFDALVNDISIGLPAELNARRNQYEYYRSKLLTFTPLDK